MPEDLSIFVVDDESIVLSRLSRALSREDRTVEVCQDPHRALEILAERTFDIVVTDIRMGEIDGLDVLDRVRRSAPATKVILITGYATIELAREALTKGAFGFLAKPFKPDELRKLIDRAAETHAV